MSNWMQRSPPPKKKSGCGLQLKLSLFWFKFTPGLHTNDLCLSPKTLIRSFVLWYVDVGGEVCLEVQRSWQLQICCYWNQIRNWWVKTKIVPNLKESNFLSAKRTRNHSIRQGMWSRFDPMVVGSNCPPALLFQAGSKLINSSLIRRWPWRWWTVWRAWLHSGSRFLPQVRRRRAFWWRRKLVGHITRLVSVQIKLGSLVRNGLDGFRHNQVSHNGQNYSRAQSKRKEEA